MNYTDPFSYLGSTAGRIVADGWIALMLGLWNAGLWLLKLALTMIDGLLTPDLSGDGPGAGVYRVSLWLALSLVLILGLVQIGLAVIRRDGRVLGRAAIGLAQFVGVWAGWLGYGITVVTGSTGLTRALMETLLKVDRFGSWQPWMPFTTLTDITDGTVATVLGVMGVVLILAAVGHLLAMLARAAALMVLAATTPIASAGLVSDLGRSWFFKSLRWFHAAALSPVLMVLVLGIGTQFTTGVATGLTGSKLDAAIGTAVPGVLLILVATFSPMALFRLLSFLDPGTTSGAAMRASLAASGGIQGLLAGRSTQSSGSPSADAKATSGEASAEQATTQRFAAAGTKTLGVLGPVGLAAGTVVSLAAKAGGAAATIGADLTNQMEVGHNIYPPDYSSHARRASTDSRSSGGQAGGWSSDSQAGEPPTGGPDMSTVPASPAPTGAGTSTPGTAAAAAPAGGDAAATAAVAAV